MRNRKMRVIGAADRFLCDRHSPIPKITASVREDSSPETGWISGRLKKANAAITERGAS
jgi:hypothetical protein